MKFAHHWITKRAGLHRLLLAVLQLYGVVVLSALALVPARFLPAEDAVILFAYSRNLAEHGVIRFLAGGPPVEGATDFGWMVLIAGAMRCGIAPEWFCAAANVIALLALGAVLLWTAGKPVRAPGLLAVAGAAGLCRQIFAAASGFAVLPDAFLLALLAFLVLRRRPKSAALTALALCLLRPDGIVFAVPLLLALTASERDRRRVLRAVGLGFLLPGLVYFFWRWHYFGELFPLPFLVKTNFHREFGILIGGSVRASLVPLLFTAIVVAPVLRGASPAAARRNRWLLCSLLVLPTLFYWTVRLDQNVASRFFFYLPTAAALLLAGNWKDLPQRRLLMFNLGWLAWLLLLAAPLYRESLTFRSMQFGRARSIAEALARLPRHGTLLASEAGFVPYYSGWPAVDPWGLNTPAFAHRFFQSGDVRRIGADLIVTHPDLGDHCIPWAGFTPGWRNSYPDRSWPHMTANLIQGAAESGYLLWRTPYGSPFYQRNKHWARGEEDRECWLVRADSPLRGEIESVLAAHGGVPPGEAVALEQARK